MRRGSVWALAALWLTTATVQAQIGERRNDLAVGINVDYTMNRMSFDPSIKQTWKNGVGGGITVRYTCEKYFKTLCAIQAEINYAKLGWKEVIETSADTYERDMHYIQLPILARLGWGYERKGAMAFLVAGPQLGYCLSETSRKGGDFSEETLSLRPNQVIQQYDMPVEHKFDYGITAGMGLECNTKVGHFQLEGRYYFALSDIYGNGKKDVFARSAHGTIVVKASYLFDVIRTKR